MAPIIQNSRVQNGQDNHESRPVEKKSELLSQIKYCNMLPDIPFDLKFIRYPFDPSRFVKYSSTSLDSSYKYEILTEHDLGVEIDQINRDSYASNPYAQLDPEDEKLLEEDPIQPQDSARSRHHASSVSWLRRTEYISTEQTRFQPQTMDKVEAKVGFTLKKSFQSENLYKDRDSQIKAIDKTFEDIKKPIDKHYSKPGVVPVEISPVLPDFQLWKHSCAHVIFDSDPAPSGKATSADMEAMSQAMIRGLVDESGREFVAYFLPVEDTLEKRKRDFAAEVEYVDDEEYKYKMAKEYNWSLKNRGSDGNQDNYFLVIKNDGVYYNELDLRVRLRKRRQTPGQQITNTVLTVKHRPLNASEFNAQRYREKQLEFLVDEEEEKKADEDEEQPQDNVKGQQNDQNEGNEDKNGSKVSSRVSSRSGSRSKLPSRSRSPSKSRSRTKSVSSARFMSRSQSQSDSLSRSRSPSPAKSGSQSPARSRFASRSPSRSRSGSTSVSDSGSESASGSDSSGSESD